eukprot:1157679-Pelagomonas_calceolata.AAC.13
MHGCNQAQSHASIRADGGAPLSGCAAQHMVRHQTHVACLPTICSTSLCLGMLTPVRHAACLKKCTNLAVDGSWVVKEAPVGHWNRREPCWPFRVGHPQ